MRATIIIVLLVFSVQNSTGLTFYPSSKNLKVANPFNFQTDLLTWKNSPAQCTQSCETKGDTEHRRVIRFEKITGKCECLLDSETEPFDDSTLAKELRVTYFYPRSL